jgi:hypothetical protein
LLQSLSEEGGVILRISPRRVRLGSEVTQWTENGARKA